MLQLIQDFYLSFEEPQKSCYLALNDAILEFDDTISSHWKYKLPFFYYNNKPFCYLWYDKKTKEPYIGIVKGKHLNNTILEQGDRKKMKILRINPCADIPLDTIYEVFKEAIKYY